MIGQYKQGLMKVSMKEACKLTLHSTDATITVLTWTDQGHLDVLCKGMSETKKPAKLKKGTERLMWQNILQKIP